VTAPKSGAARQPKRRRGALPDSQAGDDAVLATLVPPGGSSATDACATGKNTRGLPIIAGFGTGEIRELEVGDIDLPQTQHNVQGAFSSTDALAPKDDEERVVPIIVAVESVPRRHRLGARSRALPTPAATPAVSAGSIAGLPRPEGTPERRGSPTSSVPIARGAFLVSVVESTATEGGPEFTARIKPVDKMPRELIARGFRLGDAVLDVVSDLLVELVREDDGVD
jgi:hypothetical protein